MNDITKCRGINCKIKNNCYRFTLKPNKYQQSYFTKSPIKNGSCDFFMGSKIKITIPQDQFRKEFDKIIGSDKNIGDKLSDMVLASNKVISKFLTKLQNKIKKGGKTTYEKV